MLTSAFQFPSELVGRTPNNNAFRLSSYILYILPTHVLSEICAWEILFLWLPYSWFGRWNNDIILSSELFPTQQLKLEAAGQKRRTKLWSISHSEGHTRWDNTKIPNQIIQQARWTDSDHINGVEGRHLISTPLPFSYCKSDIRSWATVPFAEENL